MRESVPEKDILINFIQHGEKRGTDGFGIVKINIHKPENYKYVKTVSFSGKERMSQILEAVSENGRFEIGDILMAIHRAAPETEVGVDEQSLTTTIQPIMIPDEQLFLIHNGGVSNKIVNELKSEGYKFNTKIDSEAILHAYLKFGRNMKPTMEYLIGGFSFLMYDGRQQRLYSVSSYNPQHCGYARGNGMIYSSMEVAINEMIATLKGRNKESIMSLMNIWEDFYGHPTPEFTVTEVDVESGMSKQYPFEPRFTTATFDPYVHKEKRDVIFTLVAASGGLDSTTTLATLKHAFMNPIAVHFKYGHRGQDAEYLAIKHITDTLCIPLHCFDIEENMRSLDKGMLTNVDIPVTSASEEDIKSTAAWTVFRNHLFLTYMGALAESLMINDHTIGKVYLTGGFMQMSESGAYPDNSERFVEAGINFFKYSVCGHRIEPLFGLCNILKKEQYKLLNALGYYGPEFGKFNLGPYLISCDQPVVIDGKPHNCWSPKHDSPMCGSGVLSSLACADAGFEDLRTYYNLLDDQQCCAPLKMPQTVRKAIQIEDVIKKLEISEDRKSYLRKCCGLGKP